METEHDQTGHRLTMLLLERLRQETLRRELVVLTQALLDPAQAGQLLLVLPARATHLPALEDLALTQAPQVRVRRSNDKNEHLF